MVKICFALWRNCLARSAFFVALVRASSKSLGSARQSSTFPHFSILSLKNSLETEMTTDRIIYELLTVHKSLSRISFRMQIFEPILNWPIRAN